MFTQLYEVGEMSDDIVVYNNDDFIKAVKKAKKHQHIIFIENSVPTYCPGCSFKCQASDCDCKCHDRIREYWEKNKLRKKK